MRREGVLQSKHLNEVIVFACEMPLEANKKEKDTMKVSFFRAGKGSRTLDIDLGKVALYQLSYSRECSKFNKK